MPPSRSFMLRLPSALPLPKKYTNLLRGAFEEDVLVPLFAFFVVFVVALFLAIDAYFSSGTISETSASCRIKLSSLRSNRSRASRKLQIVRHHHHIVEKLGDRRAGLGRLGERLPVAGPDSTADSTIGARRSTSAASAISAGSVSCPPSGPARRRVQILRDISHALEQAGELLEVLRLGEFRQRFELPLRDERADRSGSHASPRGRCGRRSRAAPARSARGRS